MRHSLNFQSALVLASTFLFASATILPATTSYPGKPDAGRKNHDVALGQTGHVFNPLYVNATKGDTITFKFVGVPHSVTLADYSGPCVPWSSVHPGQPDVWSGIVTKLSPSNPVTWVWKVDTNDPRFFYCSSPESCTRYGMVFGVNPTAQQNILDFEARAMKADYQLSPGETPPPESGPSATATPSPSPSSSKGLSTAAIVGIIIGAIGVVAVIGLLFFLIGRSRRKSAAEKIAKANTADMAPVVGPGQHLYGDHPPPQYYGQGQAGYDKGLSVPVPPLSPAPSHFNPHGSMYGSPPPTNPHASWAPSELLGESASPQRVEIYTPGVDDRVPLNNPPRSP